MILRYYCLYENRKIGIESIYTVREGKQINIEGKVEKLRKLGRQEKLFCPCGCGSNLILVAGSKGLRRQHFRIKKRKANIKCIFAAEGEQSIDSKIVLKCWLDDKLKLKEDDVQSRVLVNNLSKINYRYELTFYIEKYHIGLSFINLDSYLKDEKIEILEGIPEVHIIYVASSFNEGASWQYPEYRKKIQRVQKYYLYVKLSDDNSYIRAEMRAVAYFQKLNKLWEEVTLASGLLTEFEIDEKGEIFFKGKKLIELLSQEQELFERRQEEIRQKQEKAGRKRLQKQELFERRQEEIRQKQEEAGRKRLQNECRQEKIRQEQKRLQERELFERRQEIRQKQEEAEQRYFSEHPKEKEVYELLKKATKIQGTFYSNVRGKKKEWKNTTIHIKKINFSIKKSRIEIIDNEGATNLIYIKNGQKEMGRLALAGNCYILIDLTDIDVKNVCKYISEIIGIY